MTEGRCRLKVIMKLSEMCKVLTKILSVIQLRVKIRSSCLPDSCVELLKVERG